MDLVLELRRCEEDVADIGRIRNRPGAARAYPVWPALTYMKGCGAYNTRIYKSESPKDAINDDSVCLIVKKSSPGQSKASHRLLLGVRPCLILP